MRSVREVFRLLLSNWRTLAAFEVCFRVATAALLVPGFLALVNLLMMLTGYAYLTWENVFSFIARPQVVIAIALLVFVLAALTIFEVSAVLLIFDQSREGVRISLGQAVHFALRQALRAFRPRNVLLPLYALLLVPLLNLVISTGVVRVVAVPEFIMAAVYESSGLTAAYALVMAVATLLLMRWLYVFNSFVLEGRSFRQSRRRSVELTRGRIARDLVAVLALQLGVAVAVGAGILLSLGGAVFVGDLLWETSLATNDAGEMTIALVSGLVSVPGVVLASLAFVFASAQGYACVCVRYWHRVSERGEDLPDPEPQAGARHLAVRRRKGVVEVLRVACVYLVVAGAMAFILSGDGLDWLLTLGATNANVESPALVEVTAHRGSALERPENTMAAFELAAEQGADWIELDVQQTSDGRLFVAHDSNLKRVSGVDAYAWELTWDEVSQLDAGAHFSKEYTGERYPLLSEVLAWASQANVRLNIELKPSGHEVDFEKNVAALVEEAGMQDSVIVTSQTYACLERMRAAAPELKRAYVMTLAYGDVCQLDAADIFSLEETSATHTLVSYLHQNGKEVLVWTVNSEANMERVIRNGVDNIITDDPALAVRTIDASREQSPVERAAEWLLGAFL